MSLNSSGRLTVGITMGDAAGVGPEIVLKALGSLAGDYVCKVIGDRTHLEAVSRSLGSTGVLGDSEIVDLANLPDDIVYGTDSAITGKASAEYIEKAVELWRCGEIDAVATAPISKKAISMGGYNYPGHTEFLAELTNTKKFAMSFFAGDLRVVLLSTHVSLRKAIDLIKRESLVDLITFADRTLGRLLNKKVRLAMAGLNPHASEGGMFGDEERDEILPAVTYCRDVLGIDISGPYSPDTIFLRCSQGEFDMVVALYHDQATIPVKSISFNSGVNVTLGLPLIRTSVDHGTAYDIAGKGIAQSSSMTAAIRLAAELASSK